MDIPPDQPGIPGTYQPALPGPDGSGTSPPSQYNVTAPENFWIENIHVLLLYIHISITENTPKRLFYKVINRWNSKFNFHVRELNMEIK